MRRKAEVSTSVPGRSSPVAPPAGRLGAALLPLVSLVPILIGALAAGPAAAQAADPGVFDSAARKTLIEAASAAPFDKLEANQLIWRAGRGALAGAPAARNAERERERLAALAELEQRLDPASGQATAWLGYLGVLLQQDDRDELWCAAAATVGEVGAYQWARELADELAPERPARRRVAARGALQRLYGQWFASREEAQPFLDTVRPSKSARFLVAELRAANDRASKRLLETLALQPQQATQFLTHADPAVRRGAARILGENAGTLDPAATTEALLTSLDREAEPHAFHALLQALLVHLQSKPPEAPELVRLRNTLASVVASGDDSRALSVALALSRMSWAQEPCDYDVLSGVLFIGRVLQQLSDGEGSFADDSDALVGTLEALQATSLRTVEAGRGDDLRRSEARGPVLALLQEPGRADVIRIAAASAMGPLASAQDWRLLSEVLDDPRSSAGLRHAVLGTFRSILPAFLPGTPEAHEVVAQLARVSRTPEPDLRRRAFSLLREERLTDLVRAELDPRYLVGELSKEESRGLRSDLLDLIRRFGTPDMLDDLLALPTFDTLASASPERLAELHATLRALSKGDGARTMRAAGRLAAVDNPETRLERLQRALNLVAGLDDATVRQLSPSEHRRVCAWAWWLHVAGLAPRTAVTDGKAFLERLWHIHLNLAREAEPIPGFGAGPFDHLSAVTLAELMTLDQVEGGEAQVEKSFGDALSRSSEVQDPLFAPLVMRDRARFRARAKDEERRRQALNDFRALEGQAVLENSDLRQTVALIGELSRDAQARIETFHLLSDLVARESWRAEPTAVRLQDLKDLGAVALSTGVVEHAGSVADLLAGLPDEVPTSGTAAAGPPHAWDGLEKDPGWLAELRTLRASLLGAAAPPAAAQPEPETAAETAEPPPEDGQGPAPNPVVPPGDGPAPPDRSGGPRAERPRG